MKHFLLFPYQFLLVISRLVSCCKNSQTHANSGMALENSSQNIINVLLNMLADVNFYNSGALSTATVLLYLISESLVSKS